MKFHPYFLRGCDFKWLYSMIKNNILKFWIYSLVRISHYEPLHQSLPPSISVKLWKIGHFLKKFLCEITQLKRGSRYRLETFFCRGRQSYPSTPLGVQPRPFHVNVEIKSRSPQETEDFTGMLDIVEIKHKI